MDDADQHPEHVTITHCKAQHTSTWWQSTILGMLIAVFASACLWSVIIGYAAITRANEVGADYRVHEAGQFESDKAITKALERIEAAQVSQLSKLEDLWKATHAHTGGGP